MALPKDKIEVELDNCLVYADVKVEVICVACDKSITVIDVKNHADNTISVVVAPHDCLLSERFKEIKDEVKNNLYTFVKGTELPELVERPYAPRRR